MRPFRHKVLFRHTLFRRNEVERDDRPAIQHLYGLLTKDEARNAMIFDDILHALEARRSPVVITERKDHLEVLAECLSRFAKNVVALRGGMGTKEQRRLAEALEVDTGQ